MKHTLPTETLNKILGYLATKAFSEVNSLILEIQRVATPFPEDEQKKSPALVEKK